jgi:hypothetical protein
MRRRPLRRVFLPLAVAVVQLAAAYLVLGLPDLGAARDFLTSNLPTMSGSIAASQVLVWLLLVVACATSVAVGIGPAIATIDTRRSIRFWSVAVMAVGLLVLAAGVGRHLTSSAVDISGGSLNEARAELAR